MALNIDSKFAQKEWATKLNLKLPLLSDPNRAVSKALGTLMPSAGGVDQVNHRGAIVIDKTGTVRYVHGDANKTTPQVEDVLAAVRAIS